MTLQQLEYIVAIDKYRHFNHAAESCGVTQSTLSSLVMKLEQELDITIFDRNSHPVRPTEAGEAVLNQAKVVLFNARQLQEMSQTERQQASGSIRMSVTPTIAPYLVPGMFRYLNEHYPDVKMHAFEHYREDVVAKLKRAEIDMAIMAMPQKEPDLLEIPLYRERLMAYVAPECPVYNQLEVDTMTMPDDKLWCLREETRLLPQIPELVMDGPVYTSRYEAGNLATLIRIVEETGGMTVVPELYTFNMRKDYCNNLRPLVNPVPVREVSLFVRRDYVRERMANIVVEAVKSIIPDKMIDERLKKYDIRL